MNTYIISLNSGPFPEIQKWYRKFLTYINDKLPNLKKIIYNHLLTYISCLRHNIHGSVIQLISSLTLLDVFSEECVIFTYGNKQVNYTVRNASYKSWLGMLFHTNKPLEWGICSKFTSERCTTLCTLQKEPVAI